MSPENPQDPQKGKVDEAAVPEEAKDAKEAAAAEAPAEQPAPKPKRRRKKAEPEAEGTAAAATGVDKTAADAEKAEEPVADAAADEPAVEEPVAEAAADEAAVEEPAPAETDEAAAEESEEAAAEVTPEETAPEEAQPKRRRRTRAKEEEAPAEEPKAEPARPARAPARRRDGRREVETGVLVRAQAKYVRTSARKARLVCDHIRGKDVAEARAILAFTPRAAAKSWIKLLESAVANAEHNHELLGDDLRIHSVHADEGPTLKRYRPRAMGRATRIRKRTSHLTITLTPKES
jgi:large subunit ribosomal protein L22